MMIAIFYVYYNCCSELTKIANFKQINEFFRITRFSDVKDEEYTRSLFKTFRVSKESFQYNRVRASCFEGITAQLQTL